MTDELQTADESVTDDVELNDTETGAAEDVEPSEGAGLAPGEPEKVVFDDKQQAVFNSAIGKKTHQLREQERKAQELEARLAEMEAKLPKAAAPEIPSIPDRYDFDTDAEYNQAVAERDEKIRLAVKFENEQKFAQEQKAAIEQKSLEDQQRAAVEAEAELYKRAEKNGIKQTDLMAAAQTVGYYGLNPEIANAIISDSDGDAIIMHLAENPLEADQISRMSAFEAARTIDTVIREKAQKFKSKPSSAPDPVDPLKGGGAKEESPLIAGATFE